MGGRSPWCGGLMGYIRMRILDSSIAVQLINGQQGAAGRTHMSACQVVIQGRFKFQLGMFAGRPAMFLPVLSQFCRCVFVHNRRQSCMPGSVAWQGKVGRLSRERPQELCHECMT